MQYAAPVERLDRSQLTRRPVALPTPAPLVRLLAIAALWATMPACVPATDTPTNNGNSNTTAPDIDDSLTNTAPVASAGADITVNAGDEVRLDATASSDADNDRLSYVWSQVDGDPTVDFNTSPFAAVVTFAAPSDLTAPTTFTFSVAVLDGFAAAFDQVTVTVNPD